MFGAHYIECTTWLLCWGGGRVFSPPSRSRHYSEHRLRLLEVSLDVPLAHNALELELEGTDHLLPDVSIVEHRMANVMVLFCTNTTAYRLLLPHPEKIMTVSLTAAKSQANLQPIWRAFSPFNVKFTL